MTEDNSVQTAERKAAKVLIPQLSEHLDYTNGVYNLAFKVQRLIDGKKLEDISEVPRAQLMILMRITDFLRCIQILCFQGYPEQAGTLAASVFELAHTAVFFEHSSDKVAEWLEADDIEKEMPWGILGKNWQKSVRANCKSLGDEQATEREYQVYRQLCWMKHSLPKMQDMRVEQDGVSLIFGP